MTSIKMTDIDPALALKILNVKLGSILKIAEEKYGIRDTSIQYVEYPILKKAFRTHGFHFLALK